MPKRTSSWPWSSVVVLSGGVGGARFVGGLAATLPPESLTVIVNTGDDFEHLGLRIAPDLDTVVYTLANEADEMRGWGLRDESFRALDMMTRYGAPDWFQLGDRDLAIHIMRTAMLRQGQRLTEVSRALAESLHVRPRVLPMCDDLQPTTIETDALGRLSFQDWLVKHRAPAVRAIDLGAPGTITKEVRQALEGAELILISPSNPYVSIDPILHVRGLRPLIAGRPVVAVSPIVGGKAVKGPLAEMIPRLAGRVPSAQAIAAHYAELLTGIVVQTGDELAQFEVAVSATDTIMRTLDQRAELAAHTLAFAQRLC